MIIKYGTQTRERMLWQEPATAVKYRPDFSSERAPHTNKPINVYQIIKKREQKIGSGSQMGT
jgi:hypothetical protein